MNSFMKSSSSLYRYRRETFPKNPKFRNDIMLDDDWQLTLDRSEKFVLADDGIDNKILVNIYFYVYTNMCMGTGNRNLSEKYIFNNRYLEQRTICEYFVMRNTSSQMELFLFIRIFLLNFMLFMDHI